MTCDSLFYEETMNTMEWVRSYTLTGGQDSILSVTLPLLQ